MLYGTQEPMVYICRKHFATATARDVWEPVACATSEADGMVKLNRWRQHLPSATFILIDDYGNCVSRRIERSENEPEKC